MPEYIYHYTPGPRPELMTDPDAWTEEDLHVYERHYDFLQSALDEGRLTLAGRSQDGIGPAIVVFDADNEEDAGRFMKTDPFISSGLFGGSLHPFRTALQRGQ